MIIAFEFNSGVETKSGKSVPNAIDILRELQEKHDLILLTDRKNGGLIHAIHTCEDNGVILSGIQENLMQFRDAPGKVLYDLIIDHKAVGCPMIRPLSSEAYVDWIAVRELIDTHGSREIADLPEIAGGAGPDVQRCTEMHREKGTVEKGGKVGDSTSQSPSFGREAPVNRLTANGDTLG